MIFDEFYKLLKSIFTKEPCDIEISSENFNTYLAARYISFYHPSLCELLNESINNYKIQAMFNKPEEGYNFLKAIVPKLPYKHIHYIKKEAIKNQYDKKINNEVITKLARYFEISEREIRRCLTNF